MDLEHTIDKFCLKAVTNLDIGTIAVSCMQNGSLEMHGLSFPKVSKELCFLGSCNFYDGKLH